MKLKIKQLVAWIGGKDCQSLNDMADKRDYTYNPDGFPLDTTIPVSIVGHVTQTSDDLDYILYGKKNQKSAHPYHITVKSFSQEPFPLRLLLDIMDLAQAIREGSWVPETEKEDGGYDLTKDDAADRAVKEVLGVEHEFLARFVNLVYHLWNDLEVLRYDMEQR